MTRRALPFVLAVLGVIACDDPVHDDHVAALGPETRVRPGPLHRPGQPCLVCHGGSGPSSREFSFAGTVYAVKDEDGPLANVDVQLTDASNAVKHATTNAAGNFYIEAASWSPVFPVRAEITYLGDTAQMGTHIGRDGSCASCHFEPRGPGSAGKIYVASDPSDMPVAGK